MQRLNWDDLRLFLAIARTGKLAQAGRSLALNHTTMARRLGTLEVALGARLAERTPRGIVLTATGQRLLDHAERIEAEVIAALALLGGGDAQVSGVVRLSTPEAFGTFLVAPSIALLQEMHPALRLELSPESQSMNLMKRDTDMAVLLDRPRGGKLVARKLTDYRLGLYAASDYIERHGPIAFDRLGDHPFAWYIDERIDIPELRLLREISEEVRPVFRSTSIAAQHEAVAGGLGLGVLHAFAADRDPRLVRVLADEVEIRRSYWLVIHADLHTLPHIRATGEFLDAMIAANRGRL